MFGSSARLSLKVGSWTKVPSCAFWTVPTRYAHLGPSFTGAVVTPSATTVTIARNLFPLFSAGFGSR